MPESSTNAQPESLSGYLEVMTKAMFKSGLSLKTVEGKWDGFLEAFDDFNVEKVAAYDENKIDELSRDGRIIKARRKIEATVQNANVMLDRDSEYSGFANYLRSVEDFESKKNLLKSDFAYIGDSTAHWFLDAVGEDVPDYESSKRRKKAG